MMSRILSDQPTATIFSPFPGSPDPAYAALRVDERISLTAADLRAIRRAVFGFPLLWFDASEQQHYDHVAGQRWAYGYVEQVSGPFIGNFTIVRDLARYVITLDDGEHVTVQLGKFPVLAAAIAAIWTHIEQLVAVRNLSNWDQDAR